MENENNELKNKENQNIESINIPENISKDVNVSEDLAQKKKLDINLDELRLKIDNYFGDGLNVMESKFINDLSLIEPHKFEFIDLFHELENINVEINEFLKKEEEKKTKKPTTNNSTIRRNDTSRSKTPVNFNSKVTSTKEISKTQNLKTELDTSTRKNDTSRSRTPLTATKPNYNNNDSSVNKSETKKNLNTTVNGHQPNTPKVSVKDLSINEKNKSRDMTPVNNKIKKTLDTSVISQNESMIDNVNNSIHHNLKNGQHSTKKDEKNVSANNTKLKTVKIQPNNNANNSATKNNSDVKKKSIIGSSTETSNFGHTLNSNQKKSSIISNANSASQNNLNNEGNLENNNTRGSIHNKSGKHERKASMPNTRNSLLASGQKEDNSKTSTIKRNSIDNKITKNKSDIEGSKENKELQEKEDHMINGDGKPIDEKTDSIKIENLSENLVNNIENLGNRENEIKNSTSRKSIHEVIINEQIEEKLTNIEVKNSEERIINLNDENKEKEDSDEIKKVDESSSKEENSIENQTQIKQTPVKESLINRLSMLNDFKFLLDFSNKKICALNHVLESKLLGIKEELKFVFINKEMFSRKIKDKKMELKNYLEEKIKEIDTLIAKYRTDEASQIVITKKLVISRSAITALNLIKLDEEKEYIKKASVDRQSDILRLIFLYLNERYDDIEQAKLPEYFTMCILKKYKVETFKKLVMDYLPNNLLIIDLTIPKIVEFVEKRPHVFNSSEFISSNRLLSYCTFLIKDIYDYLTSKLSDGSYAYHVRRGGLIRKKYSDALEKIK